MEVRLLYRGMSKLHKGYGFVDLDSEKSMQEALAKDRIPIDGRPMLVGWQIYVITVDHSHSFMI